MDRKYFWFLHPRSFLGLIVVGFLLVALPLIAALVTGAYYIDRMTKQSQEAVYRAVQATQTTREIINRVGIMERAVRQYLVLRDPMFMQSYLENHLLFEEKTQHLQKLLVDPKWRARLNYLDTLEAQLFSKTQYFVQEDVDKLRADGFIELTEKSNVLLDDTNQLIDSEMSIMHDMSNDAQKIIYWEIMAVIPMAVIIIIVFAVLLTRPVKQIESAIRKLGAGEFDQPIVVGGPTDIRYLGERLEWLRMRLKYLEDKKVKFLSYVSHELKTPLTSIREGAELLSEGVIGPLNSHQVEVAQILRKSSISLQKMIEKLLSFNMSGKASESKVRDNVHMRHVIDTVIADHKPVAIAKRLQVTVDGPDVSVYGDEEQLRVLVDNLLSNAIKHTPEQGSIHLFVADYAGTLVLDVIDSGPGISKDEKEKVFEAYYSGKNPGKGYIRGSGLGLSIAREFVEAHHGTIEVVAEDARNGGHFRVRLPKSNSEHVNERELAWAV